MVVCKLLASGSRCSRCLSSGHKVGEFGLGFRGLVLYANCGGAYVFLLAELRTKATIRSKHTVSKILGDRVVLNSVGCSRGIYCSLVSCCLG